MRGPRVYVLFLVGLILWGLLGAFGAQAAPRVRYNFWPLFFYQKSPKAWELELLGPIFYRYHTALESGTSLRPLFSSVYRRGQHEVFFLSPLGHYLRTKTFSRLRLVPLISKDFVHKGWGENRSYHEYGLVFWGKTADGKRYGGLFPLYGHLYHWGFRDEITFFLWPLYVHSRYDGNDSYTLLWPIFNFTHGPTVKRLRLWPLFGHRVREHREMRTFFFWPFFWHSKYCVSCGGRGEKYMFFPFIIWEKSPRTTRYMFLYPFFKYLKSQDLGYVEYDFPWPFLRYVEGKYDRERRFWPFLGYTETMTMTKGHCHWHFFLWPLYSYEYCFSPDPDPKQQRITENRKFFLLSKVERVRNGQGKELYLYARWWPLGAQIKRADGSEIFYFPALLPFEDEGLNRNYAPFLRLYEYVHDPRGFTRSKALWGLYRHDVTPTESFVDLAFIINYHRRGKAWELSLLKGLFALGNKANAYRLKLFFLKIF